MAQAIPTLVEEMAQVVTMTDVFNPYAHGDENNAIRRANLLRYLQQMVDLHPRLLLVAEAPGYRGCRLTGIPVTSRAVMLDGIPELGLFGAERGYQMTHDPGFEKIQREQSATILWGTLAELGVAPLLWNAFPFHPHKPGNLLSNRKPRQSETMLGYAFLREVLNLFGFKQVVAVGNVAETTLNALGVACMKVRHPAQGGKSQFVSGIRRIIHHVC